MKTQVDSSCFRSTAFSTTPFLGAAIGRSPATHGFAMHELSRTGERIRVLVGADTSKRGRGGSAWIATVALLWAQQPLAAQEIVLVNDSTYCQCELQLERLVTLGDADGLGALRGEIRRVRRDSNGIYYVLAYREPHINRFTSDGRALAPIGSPGKGPGEAIGISTFVMEGDSIFAFDPSNLRMTVFSRSGELGRTAPFLGMAMDATFVSNGGVVLNARTRDSRTFGIPLHLINRDGARIRSFGGEGVIRPRAGTLWFRKLAASDGGVWAAHENQHVIEHWSLDGIHTRNIERTTTDWFEPYLLRSWGGPDEPINPQIADLVVDDRGYLRTIVVRASPHWADRLPPPRRNAIGDLVYPVPPGIGIFESLVEIIDPEAGRLFVSGVFEEEVRGFVDAEHVYSYTEGSDGIPRITIWRLRLALSSSPPGGGTLVKGGHHARSWRERRLYGSDVDRSVGAERTEGGTGRAQYRPAASALPNPNLT